MNTTAIEQCRASIAQHSKSFSLASKLLPVSARDETAAVYAYCRRADDLIDLISDRPPSELVTSLRSELDSIYRGEAQSEPALSLFQQVVMRHGIPRHYPEELLAGMAMDATDTAYADLDELLVYCFRVAGTVGLMMSHVFGVQDARALRHAAHLGMAMQLTNICRDVREDWDRARLYLPDALLTQAGAPGLRRELGYPLELKWRRPLASVIRELLHQADSLYSSGAAGIRFLPFRPAIAVRTARLVYADIGRVVLSRDADPFAPRAFVSTGRKLRLAFAAAITTAIEAPRSFRRAELTSQVIGFQDVVPS